MYIGIWMTSTLHMPVVPVGQVTPGGAASAVAKGAGGAAFVAGADGATESDGAGVPLAAAGPGTTGASNGLSMIGGLLLATVAAVLIGLSADAAPACSAVLCSCR
jgi:hypothetical protein